MNYAALVSIAPRALLRNKIRSLLTVLDSSSDAESASMGQYAPKDIGGFRTAGSRGSVSYWGRFTLYKSVWRVLMDPLSRKFFRSKDRTAILRAIYPMVGF